MFLIMYSAEENGGDSGKVKLEATRQNGFKKGATATFNAECVELGQLSKVCTVV